MLVLSRQERPASGRNEKSSITLTIPPSSRPQLVTIDVLSIHETKVRLGIEADREIAILRADVNEAPRPAA